jgi:hypothetical protein
MLHLQLAPDCVERDLSPPGLNWNLLIPFLKFFLQPSTGSESAKKYFYINVFQIKSFCPWMTIFSHKEQFILACFILGYDYRHVLESCTEREYTKFFRPVRTFRIYCTLLEPGVSAAPCSMLLLLYCMLLEKGVFPGTCCSAVLLYPPRTWGARSYVLLWLLYCTLLEPRMYTATCCWLLYCTYAWNWSLGCPYIRAALATLLYAPGASGIRSYCT